MNASTKCGKCGATDFEANLERVGDAAWFWFIRCRACKTVAGVTTAESAPAMLHDVLKALKDQSAKIDSIVAAIGIVQPSG